MILLFVVVIFAAMTYTLLSNARSFDSLNKKLSKLMGSDDDEAAEWSYDPYDEYGVVVGPDGWAGLGYSDCDGTAQSPIDIPATKDGYTSTSAVGTVASVTTMLAPATYRFEFSQSHHAPKFTCKSEGMCGVLTHPRTEEAFDLVQIHFHSPSEHTVDGKHFPLEGHMVHQSPTTGAYAVLGILFDSTAADDDEGTVTEAIDTMWNYMSEEDTDTSEEINLYNTFMTNTSGFYNYNGSFTTPPCTEGVSWFIQAEVLPLRSTQIETFWDHIGGYPGNSRPVQALNGRSINYEVRNVKVDHPVTARSLATDHALRGTRHAAHGTRHTARATRHEP
jgi:carbonic anhydrase